MSSRAVRRLRDTLAERREDLERAFFTQAVVTAIGTRAVTVRPASAAPGDPGITVPHVSSYVPTVGDVALLAGPPGSWTAIGAAGGQVPAGGGGTGPHSHTAGDVGAAPAAHSHDYAATSHGHDYAPTTHGHTAGEVGAAAASHTHDYAASSHAHPPPDLSSRVPTSRVLTAGDGLVGGGDLTTDRDFAVAFGTSSSTAARGDHTHESGGGGGPHSHTAAEVGAASSTHTHTPGSVGAAPASHEHSGADITSGTVALARLPVGTTSSTVARGDRVQALENRNPTDAGVHTRRSAANQAIAAATNTLLALGTVAHSTAHVTNTSATAATIATDGWYILDAGCVVGTSTAMNGGLWIGSPNFTTARYAQSGLFSCPASTFPAFSASATVYLTAGTQLSACVYFTAANTVTTTYGLTHLTIALLRRS